MHVISAWKPYLLITKNEDKQKYSRYRDKCLIDYMFKTKF